MVCPEGRAPNAPSVQPPNAAFPSPGRRRARAGSWWESPKNAHAPANRAKGGLGDAVLASVVDRQPFMLADEARVNRVGLSATAGTTPVPVRPISPSRNPSRGFA